MRLRSGGLDIYYVDESHDQNHYVVTAVCIPFLRNIRDKWHIVWPDYLDIAKEWRKKIRDNLHIPQKKELHGIKLASGRGHFLHGRHNFKLKQAVQAYAEILSDIDFVRREGIMSVAASKDRFLYGHERLEAAMYALFQRMRRKALEDRTNAIAFFDQGHPEYRKLYRMAQVYLQTGSALGGWETGPTKNLPMDMFTKDANEKNSKHCYFTQTADLIAYAAFLKIKAEHNQLTAWQKIYGFDELYDEIDMRRINRKVSRGPPRDGIVRLK